MLEVSLTQQVRSGQQLICTFEVYEPDVPFEWEVDFVTMQNVEERDFVSSEAEHPQGIEEGFDIVEAIRNQKHQAAPPRQPSPPRPAMRPSGAQGPVAAPVAAMTRAVPEADGSGADRARIDVPARDVRMSALPAQNAAVRAVSPHGSLEAAAVHAADADRESLKQRLLSSTPYDVALRAAIDWAVSDGPASGTAIAAARRAASGEDARGNRLTESPLQVPGEKTDLVEARVFWPRMHADDRG